MTARTQRTLWIAGGSVAGLLVLATIAALIVVRTDWFREFARNKIIETVETATGGRVELTEFQFSTLPVRATIRGFVLHGTEPAGDEPLFQADSVAVDIKLLPALRRAFEIAAIDLNRPRVNFIVFPDGRTNVPNPKATRDASGKGPLETVVDLAIGTFRIRDGNARFRQMSVPFSGQGENLRAELSYDHLAERYSGSLSLNPLYLQTGENPRLDVAVNLPVILEKDRVALDGATFKTPQSQITLTGAIENLKAPNLDIKATGRVDVPEMAAAFGQPLNFADPQAPRIVSLNLEGGMKDDRVEIGKAELAFGQSTLAADGSFENAAFENGSVNVRGRLIVEELARLLKQPLRASGVIEITGLARIRAAGDYGVDGSINGRSLSFRQGSVAVDNIQLASTIQIDPNLVRVDPIRVDIAGGRLTAQARVENRQRYQVAGNLVGFQLQRILAVAGANGSAWGGTVSGPVSAEGAFDSVALRTARARLSISPNGRGIPLRGEVAAVYDGATESIDVGQSYLAFPSSRLDFSGSLNQRLDVRLVSRNLNDFRPAIALASSQPAGELPLRLQPAGAASLTASLMGRLSSPAINGSLQLDRFLVEDRAFDRLTAAFRAASTGVAIENGMLSQGPLQASVNASVGLRGWKPEPDQPLSAAVSLQNGDVRDVLALAGQSDLPVRGQLAVSARAMGTVGDPRGAAELHVRNGEAYSEPIESLDGEVSFGGELVTLSSLRVVSNQASVDMNAVFRHPTNTFTSGTLRGHVEANQVALARISAIQKQRPGLNGTVQLNLNAEVQLRPPETASPFDLVAVNGTFAVRDIQYGGEEFGGVSAAVETNGDEIAFRLESDFAGSEVRANGRTRLAPDYPTSASLDIANLPVEDALRVAGQRADEARGLLSAKGEVSGTWENPEGDLTIGLTRAVYREQPVDRAEIRVRYREASIEIPSMEIQAGANRLKAEGSFKHPARDFSQGDVTLSVETNSVQLAQLVHLQKMRPGLRGTVQIAIAGEGRFDSKQSTMPVSFRDLSVKAEAKSLAVNGASYGELTLSAEESGSAVKVTLDSNVAKSTIRAAGEVRMTPDYPVTAQVDLTGLRYSNFAGLIAKSDLTNPAFDAVVEGKINVSGPALKPARMTGSAEFARVEAYTTTRSRAGQPGRQIAVRNAEPVRLAATEAGIEIRSAHWTGPSTDLSLAGTLALQGERLLNLTARANADLALLRDFDADISSEGAVALDAKITGPVSEPVVNGRVELKDAAYQQAGMLNGLSKANGVIQLTGTTARFESFTAETGGGQVTLSGSVSRAAGVYRFDLQGRTRNVRVRTEAGVSVTSNATFRLSGTDRNSLVSGDVDIRTVAFTSRTDFGSVLSRAAPPPETPSAKTGMLDAMRLNVNVRMGTNTTFHTTFAENLDASADLTVRGTAANPGMLGRVIITEGELVFFGTKYNVNEGTVSFYNPNKIEPMLNLNLSTTARGVNVVLMVTGSIQNMNLGYQSDPPLQFSEIVALLAAGRLPTSDPILVAHQPATPPQTLPQMGASALVSAAVANPIAGQLERVFGVTQLKIDPTFTSGSELPQARLTLQQQITSDLTFTYVTNLTRSDPQIVRAEWAIDDNWSAIATRQENGMVGLDLFYKRRFQ